MRRVLTFKRARTYAPVLIGVLIVAWVYELRTATPPIYGTDVPIGGDYIAFHAAGRLLREGLGGQLYERAPLVAAQDALLHGLVPGFYDAFRNPPFAALPFVPLSLLELVPGFVAWSLVSLTCLGLAIWLFLQELPDLRRSWRGLLILVFAFAPVILGLIDGQNATVSLLLFVLLYRALLHHQERRAGFWSAVGLFKPQLFLVFPVVLAARRSKSGLGVYGLTAVALAVVSVLLVGVDGSVAWVRILLEPESGQVLANAWRMVSLKSFLDVLLPGLPALALAIYAVSAMGILAGVWRLWSALRPAEAVMLREPATEPVDCVRAQGSASSSFGATTVDVADPRALSWRRQFDLAWIFTSLAAVLVDPHLVDYDLTVLIPAGVLAAREVPATRWPMVVLYVLLLFRAHVPLADIAQIQLSALVLLVCFGLVARTALLNGSVPAGARAAFEHAMSR